MKIINTIRTEGVFQEYLQDCANEIFLSYTFIFTEMPPSIINNYLNILITYIKK